MPVTNQDGRGPALSNKASTILELSECLGPVTLVVTNEGSNPIVVSVVNKVTGANLATADETAVAAEATGYTGDTTDLTFSGQVLNNLPIIPGSVTIKPTAGGTTVNAVDTNGDGILYTVDVDADVAGTVNYLTGAVTLVYPAGKAPNTGAIGSSYSYAGDSHVAKGKRVLQITNLPPTKILQVKAAGLGGASVVDITAVISY